jgi:hypothetical protein
MMKKIQEQGNQMEHKTTIIKTNTRSWKKKGTPRVQWSKGTPKALQSRGTQDHDDQEEH